MAVHFVDHVPCNGTEMVCVQLMKCDFDDYEKFAIFRRKINTNSLFYITHVESRLDKNHPLKNRILKQVNSIIRNRILQLHVDFFVKFKEHFNVSFSFEKKMESVQKLVTGCFSSHQKVSSDVVPIVDPIHATRLFQILIHSDVPVLQALACTNQLFNKCINELAENIDLNTFCPQLAVVDVDYDSKEDAYKVNKLSVISGYKEMVSKIDTGTYIMLCTWYKDFSLEDLIEDAREFSIALRSEDGSDFSINAQSPLEETYSFLISCSPLKKSKCYYEPSVELDEQQNRVWIGCEMAPFHEYLYSSLLMEIGLRSAEGDEPVDHKKRSLTCFNGFPMYAISNTPEGFKIQKHNKKHKERAVGFRRVTTKSSVEPQ